MLLHSARLVSITRAPRSYPAFYQTPNRLQLVCKPGITDALSFIKAPLITHDRSSTFVMSSKTTTSKSSDLKDDKPAQKPNVSLEEDDEFEDFPVEGELLHRCCDGIYIINKSWIKGGSIDGDGDGDGDRY